MGSLTQIIIRSSVVVGIYAILTVFGNLINNFFLKTYLTQFFVLLRTVVKPLNFLWDFDTSFTLLGLSISILVVYFILKSAFALKYLLVQK